MLNNFAIAVPQFTHIGPGFYFYFPWQTEYFRVVNLSSIANISETPGTTSLG